MLVTILLQEKQRWSVGGGHAHYRRSLFLRLLHPGVQDCMLPVLAKSILTITVLNVWHHSPWLLNVFVTRYRVVTFSSHINGNWFLHVERLNQWKYEMQLQLYSLVLYSRQWPYDEQTQWASYSITGNCCIVLYTDCTAVVPWQLFYVGGVFTQAKTVKKRQINWSFT